MIQYQFFPRSHGMTEQMKRVVTCFENQHALIDSSQHTLASNEVLTQLSVDLIDAGFFVEMSKTKEDKINVPVLFGLNNKIDKFFNADALSHDGKIVIEVEAGRAVINNQFLKDIFQACMMHEVEYLVIAVRNMYRANNDFESVKTFLETLYISNRLHLPLKGILLIGY
ncbi:MAG: hypothetical protein H6R05_130 [Burkholderiaceae bacterium]|nr:hypothetical protein [Burkholderiaceae bacterium]